MICFSNMPVWLGNHRQMLACSRLQMLGARAADPALPILSVSTGLLRDRDCMALAKSIVSFLTQAN